MNRFSQGLERMLTVVAVSMFLVFVLSVTYQVIARYIAFVPRAYWTEEISRVAFIWMVFVAAALGVKHKEHFVLDILPLAYLRYPLNLAVSLLADVIVAIISLYLIIGGSTFTLLGLDRYSSTSGLELYLFYLSIPISGFFFLIFSALNIISTIQSREKWN